jgi:hypothetical protein
MPILDRLVQFDDRSRYYPARALVGATVGPRSYTWSVPTLNGTRPLDQGNEGACVGHAWAHEAAARPVVRDDADSALAFRVYREAQKIDAWPGENYSGTSVIAGAQIMQRLGFLTEYRWAFTLDDALTVVSRRGPAVIGVNWYTGMWDTDAKGYLHVTGRVEGGHAILLTGVSLRHERVTLYNSWGLSWGMGGRAYLSFTDFDRIRREDGEVCVPVVRHSV